MFLDSSNITAFPLSKKLPTPLSVPDVLPARYCCANVVDVEFGDFSATAPFRTPGIVPTIDTTAEVILAALLTELREPTSMSVHGS